MKHTIRINWHMKRVLVDMDEVIADTTGGMIEWYRHAYGGGIDYKKMLEGKSLVKGFPEEHQAAVRQQLFEPGFFRHLPVIEHSIEVLEQMNKQYEVYSINSRYYHLRFPMILHCCISIHGLSYFFLYVFHS